MTRGSNLGSGGLGRAPGFLTHQAVMDLAVLIPVLTPVWWRGSKVLWCSEQVPRRGLAWVHGVLVVFFAVAAKVALAVEPGPEDGTGYDTYLRQHRAQAQVVATLGNSEHLKIQGCGGRTYHCTDPDRPRG